jgi:hypothetical protein
MENDGTLGIKPYDFNAWLRDARLGFVELSARHTTLLERIASDTKEADEIYEQLQKLASGLKSFGIEPEKSLARPRSSNVSAATEKIVKQIFDGNPAGAIVTESNLIAAVKADSPSMLDKSIQGALYKMVVSGKITRHGKRGSYAYSSPEVKDGSFKVSIGDPGPVVPGATNGSPEAALSIGLGVLTPGVGILTPAVGQMYPREQEPEPRPNWASPSGFTRE